MPAWNTIPTLNSLGAKAVRSFAATIGLSERALRQSDWEAIPYFPPLPATEAEQEVVWDQQTYAVYRVRTQEKHLWLFWFAIKGWRTGEMLPIAPEIVAHWHRVEEGMVTPCSHRACLNPALVWPGPAVSITIQIFDRPYVVDLYGCGEAHRQALRGAEAITVELAAGGSMVGRETISLSSEEQTRQRSRQEISERRGRLPGCPYDQWVFVILDLWQEQEIAAIEEVLRRRLQEYTDHFNGGEYSSTFWRLRVSYNHRRFFARNGSTQFEATTAEELARMIDQDYAALRASWSKPNQPPEDASHA
jgi:hypothetical protein